MGKEVKDLLTEAQVAQLSSLKLNEETTTFTIGMGLGVGKVVGNNQNNIFVFDPEKKLPKNVTIDGGDGRDTILIPNGVDINYQTKTGKSGEGTIQIKDKFGKVQTTIEFKNIENLHIQTPNIPMSLSTSRALTLE